MDKLEIEGIFIPFNAEEKEKIFEYLQDCEYEESGKGLKELILEIVNEEDALEEDGERLFKTGEIVGNAAKVGLDLLSKKLRERKK